MTYHSIINDGGGSRIPRVLVLEDDPDTLVVLGRLLSAIPAYAVPTASCAAARYACKTLGAFDVLIADRKLPDGDGVELAVELKRACGCGTVIMSGTEEPPGGLPEGIDLWIVKPVLLPGLRAAVESLTKA